ncbi:MAG: solute carrier family 23 protein [Syntrophobacteraceae bacterium]
MEQSPYIYGIDDRPPIRYSFLYALQWAVIMFPVLVTAAALPAKVLGLGPAEEVRFFQLILLTSGFFTAVQCLWGHRYPVIDGPSTALLLTFLVLAPYGIPAIQGGTILGGALLMAAVLVVKPRRIIPWMTPNVVGVILMLIALTLLPYLSRLMAGVKPSAPAGSAVTFVLSIVLVLLMATLAYRLKGFLKTISLLIGMLIGTALFYAVELPIFTAFHEAAWLSFPSDIIPSRPAFTLPAMVAFAVSYVAVVVNSVGSIQAIANITTRDRMAEAIPRGLFLNGAAGVVCGLMGIIGTVSYSISPGVVLSNRVASRFAAAYGGIMFGLAAFFPRFAALLALVPPPVVGAALCAAMGVQIGAALSIIAEGGMERRDYFVVGLPVLVGTLLGFLPQGLVESVPQVFRVFIGNGLIFGILLVLLLEHVLMRAEGSIEPWKGCGR